MLGSMRNGESVGRVDLHCRRESVFPYDVNPTAAPTTSTCTCLVPTGCNQKFPASTQTGIFFSRPQEALSPRMAIRATAAQYWRVCSYFYQLMSGDVRRH